MTDKTLIYLHVPKCGGTTLHAILRKSFAEPRRFYVNGSDIASSREELAALSPERRSRIDLLHGHLSYGWHEILPREAVYFTLIREPVARVVSHYNYVRFRSDRDHYLREAVEREDMSIAEYVQSGVCDEVNNGQVRLLAGVEDIVQAPYGVSKLPYGTNDPALLERALHNVEKHFAVVGLQERFDESLLLLKARLGLRDITYRARNVGRHRYKKHRPTAEEIEVIKEYNELDLALYALMLKRFAQDLEAARLPAARLKLFRLQNGFSALSRSMRKRLRSVIPSS